MQWFKPVSFKTKSVQIALTGVSHVGAAVLAQVARSSRSDFDADHFKVNETGLKRQKSME